MAEHHGLHLGMPAFVGGAAGALGLKVVTVYPDNPAKHQLPTTIGTLLLNDARTGALLAIMDAGLLTAMRTGAASGVATKHLARADARTVGVFGAGVQARTQLWAVSEVRGIQRALVCDIAAPAREKFAEEMTARLGFPIESTDDPLACLDCDILIAATSSRTPLFDGARLRPGTHINGVGAHSPDAREFDLTAVKRSKFVADHAPACLAEAGELMIPIKEGALTEAAIHASLGEIVAGLKPGRASAEEITFFKSCGLAVQDVATAARVYQLARARGVGAEIAI
jgi:ornithine cyclodeaminase/alanine dehydrogenase